MLKYKGTSEMHRSGADVVSDARIALRHLEQASQVLERSFKIEKGNRRGTSTDEEQDLLRARLVLASAGLDAVLKYLCFRAIPYMASRKDEIVSRSLIKQLSKILRNTIKNPDKDDTDFIAEILLADSSLEVIVKKYVHTHFNESMQSYTSLKKVAELLGIGIDYIKNEKNEIKEAFQARNDIVHELDMDPFGTRRKRIQRRVHDINDMCRTMRRIAFKTINLVEKRIDDLE